LACGDGVTACYNRAFMVEFILALPAAVRVFFRSRGDTALEILALRQQVAVLKRKRPHPNLSAADLLFWTFLRVCLSQIPNNLRTWGLRIFHNLRLSTLGVLPALVGALYTPLASFRFPRPKKA